jgi:N-acetylneuraminate synthase
MHAPSKSFAIGERRISLNDPTYFIADVAANHDGNLSRAKELIHLCAEAGAEAAKFQHFAAKTIVSDRGFRELGSQQSHQAKWKKSVYQVYDEASLNVDWTAELKQTCDEAGITFFTSPYSYELVDSVDPYVPAYKVGSGDITWLDIISYMARKKKPLLIAAGASTEADVKRAVDAALEETGDVALMQCNTNYTGSLENFRHIHLRVLDRFRAMYPGMVLGLSDHTPGHATVLGAVTLGARVIEKHFTDDTKREGPDHGFSMDPKSWRDMVDRTRELELSLGSTDKFVAENEAETVVLQRRSVRAARDIASGATLGAADVEVLRPSPPDGIQPYEMNKVIGKKSKRTIERGEHLRWIDLA